MQLDITRFQKPQKKLELKDVTPEVVKRDNEALKPESKEAPPAEASAPRGIDGEILRDGPVLPTALRGIDLSKLTSKAALICALTHNLPRNDFRMPMMIYRPDILDAAIFCISNDTLTSTPPELATTPTRHDFSRPQTAPLDHLFRSMQEQLDVASITLDYFEGYPALGGHPLWEQLPWESPEEYDLFRAYLELPGARQLALVPSGKREHVGELFHTNYWSFRCDANDAFCTVHAQRQRERRIIQTDDQHFLMAERLLSKMKGFEGEVAWELLKEDPEKYVQTLERLVKLQRTALGNLERKNEDDRGLKSVEVIMRKTAEKTQPLIAKSEESGLDIMNLLRDPKSAEAAQELILRVNSR